jgi:hypothetical protein
MITYTTADKWLKSGGVLTFVITQTHFQSPSSQGFRKFRIDKASRLVPLGVDDLKALKPFPDAANKTAIARFRKSSTAPKYPVPYYVWRAATGATRAIPPTLLRSDVMKRVTVAKHEATPVGKEGSPWAVLPPGRFAKLQKLAGKSAWVQGRKGITADLNGVYFVATGAINGKENLVEIRTRPESGKTDIGASRTFWVEPGLLFPLLKGASDFEPCYISPRNVLFAIVPNDGITQDAYDRAQKLLDTDFPKTKSYFKTFEKWLRARSTLTTRMPGAPYFAVYNVGAYSFAPFKVVWAEQSGAFCAAVATSANVPLFGPRPYVPDHKIFFVEFDQEAPAYFLCGLLNATAVKEFVESHNISIQVGDIFKHMNLLQFLASDTDHKELARLTKRAHAVADKRARDKVVCAVRALADKILG